MKSRMFWGIATLIILLVGVSVFLLMQNTNTEPDITVNPLTPEEEELVKSQIQDAIDKAKVPTARPGYKMVLHDDHYHEVPISETEVSTPNAKSVETVPKTTKKGLTYHAKLLETNPVKALRLQAEERGHWSKDHLPPFPTDDTEAQEYARSLYLMHYYESIDLIDTPIWSKAAKAFLSQMRTIDEYPNGARRKDLWRLTWTNTDAGEITPYGGMTRYGRARLFRSDYFPDFIDVPK